MTNRPPIIEYDPALPIAHVTAAFDLGSLLDPVGKEGSTSLLFRLLRRSALGLSASDVEAKLDSLGASAGIDVARSIAALQGTSLSRSWETFSDLLLSMLSAFPENENEFTRLKSEADAEWVESLDNDSLLARRFFVRHIFPNHLYARLTSGTKLSLSKIELDDLRAIYAQVVHPDRLITTFSGDIATEQADNFVTRLRQNITSSAQLAAPDLDDPHVPNGRRLLFVDKPERSQAQIMIGCLGGHPSDQDRTALYVGNTIFGGTFSARLSREVRGKRGWSYGAYSQLSHDRKRQSFSMYTFPQASDAAACIKLQLSLFEELVQHGVTSGELSAAKKYLLNSHAFSRDTASKRAALRLDQEIYHLPPIEGFKERVSAVTVDDVSQALTRRLSTEHLSLVVLGTAEQLLSGVQDAISDLSETKVVQFDSAE